VRARLVASAVAVGVLAGAAGAAVHGDGAAPARSTARSPAAGGVPIEPVRERGRLPDGRYDPSYVHLRVHRSRIALRVPDPAGGPDWAVRVLDADRLSLQRPARTLAGALVVGRNRCVQLGRLRGGTFGWVFGDGRFRRIGREERLLQCTSRKRPELMARFETTLAIDDPAAPRPVGTVVWGLAPGARSVRVAGTGAADGPAEVGGDAFLRLAGPDARPRAGARLEAGADTYPLGPRDILPPQVGRKFRFPTIVPGTERVEARAPDPAGGPGYGVPVAETREGQPCAGSEGRVVADRLGDVDLRLALFAEPGGLTPTACRPLETAPTREHACDVGIDWRNVEEMEGVDAFLRRARIERRLLAGRTTVRAQCHADVERVTLQTPRDVRTLVPSPVGRVVLAVYDGEFPGGDLLVTAHFRGGGTWRDRMSLGF
jgi:hypothetical protein